MVSKRVRTLARRVVLGVLWKEITNPSEILEDENTDLINEVYKEVEIIYDRLQKKWSEGEDAE